VGTHPSGRPSSHQGDQSNRLTSLELFPYLRSTAGEPPRRNTAAVVELYRRRLGSPPFHPLRSTPTITSPPAKPAQSPLVLPGQFSVAAGDHRRRNLAGDSRLPR
jgi:hypothetical protein